MYPVYVKVILPFALEGTFTYSIPNELEGSIQTGYRVLVQFGQKRIYAGIVAELLMEPDSDLRLKPVLAVLDDAPLLNDKQLYFWQWLHKYYLCPIGDVMRAALPSAFKLSSESIFFLTDQFEIDKTELDEKAFAICELLLEKKELSLSELEQKSGMKNVWKTIQNLLKRGLLSAEENVQAKYKPKMEKCVRLSDAYDEESLGELLDHIEKKAPKQHELLLKLLELSEEKGSVAQTKLLNFADATSSSLKSLAEKGAVEIFEQKIDRLAMFEGSEMDLKPQTFSPAQQKAFDEVKQSWETQQVCLLHGITGSGKTHIYIELISEIIAKGKQVLYLLPEIALTTQIIKKLQSVFGKKVGVYHSGFNDAERIEIWEKIENHEYDIILAARSGLFLPFTDLGLVIVDEEHDASYKQFDPAPRYQARDAAIYLANIHKGKVLLGTATPSLESYENAQEGKYAYVKLEQRFGQGSLPKINIQNTHKLEKRKEMTGYFSNVLLEKMEQALEQNQQIILFQNRRGYAPYVRFQESNEVPMCPSCDVSLTYHRINAELKCHYCGFKATVQQTCKRYGANDMQVVSFGTEQIEEEVLQRFPDAKVERLDLDNTRRKNAHAEIIRRFEQGETDILVGTQMVTKGLDFDSVALVAVMQADHILRFPDFRSAERAYQLMEQVSGRAGRKKNNGEVLIQTTMPNHFVLQTLLTRNEKGFYQTELAERRAFSYPPYYRLIKIGLKHRQSPVLWEAANALEKILRPRLKGELLGPTTPLVGRVKNQYLVDFMLKMEKNPRDIAANKAVLHAAALHLKSQKIFSTVHVYFDVDP